MQGEVKIRIKDKHYKRYKTGLELEKAGNTPARVAELLGFANAHSWTTCRAYYKRIDKERGIVTEKARQMSFEPPKGNDFMHDLTQHSTSMSVLEEMPTHHRLSISRAKGLYFDYQSDGEGIVFMRDGEVIMSIRAENIDTLIREIKEARMLLFSDSRMKSGIGA